MREDSGEVESFLETGRDFHGNHMTFHPGQLYPGQWERLANPGSARMSVQRLYDTTIVHMTHHEIRSKKKSFDVSSGFFISCPFRYDSK